MRRLCAIAIILLASCETTVVQVGPQDVDPVKPSMEACKPNEINPEKLRDIKDPMGVRASTYTSVVKNNGNCIDSIRAQNQQNYNSAVYAKQEKKKSFWTGFKWGSGTVASIITTIAIIIAAH